MRAPKVVEQTVIYRPLRDLVPYTKNARTHSPRQIMKIKDSLEKFGWGAPMLTARDQMLAGHGRLTAAVEMMMEGRPVRFNPDPTKGPTIDLSHLSAVDRRAYILADNRLATEAGWDMDLLRGELTDLSSLPGFNVTITGFDTDEIKAIFDGCKTDFTRLEHTPAALDPLLGIAKILYLRKYHEAMMAALEELVSRFEGASIES